MSTYYELAARAEPGVLAPLWTRGLGTWGAQVVGGLMLFRKMLWDVAALGPESTHKAGTMCQSFILSPYPKAHSTGFGTQEGLSHCGLKRTEG